MTTAYASSLDYQYVSSAAMMNQAVGHDGGKKIKGRKRVSLVDTLGLLITAKVVAARVPERGGAKQVLQQITDKRERLPRLKRMGGWRLDFLKTVIDCFGLILEVVLRLQRTSGFVLFAQTI